MEVNMEKLIYGKLGQVKFKNIKEKEEAFEYLLTSENVDFNIHEDNQFQGAWGPEDRIHFKTLVGVPECLKRNMTAGNLGAEGRINCKELCEELRKEHKKRTDKE